MNKQFLTACMFLAFAYPVQAQKILKGNVADASHQSIPSVTIRILTPDSVFVNGTITDEKGTFTFTNVNDGKYMLAASSIGYLPAYLNFEMPEKNHTLPLITLQADNVLLDAVTVTASSVIRKKDHLLVIPNKKQIKHSFSGYDLLYNLMIPGLTVDRKNKTVTAMSGAATLYINGVKADMREVQNLPPKDIERIEYYTLPTTGQFMGDAASINYITKVYKTGGYVTLDGEQTIGYLKGDYNIGAKVSHNHTDYTFFGGYAIAEYDGMKNEKSELLVFPDYNINRQTMHEGADYQNNQQYAQFKVSNDRKKRNLSAVASLVRNATPHNDQNELLKYTGYDEHSESSSDRNDNESLKSAINLNGIFKVSDKKEWKIRLNGAYTRNSYNRAYTEGKQNSVSNAEEDLYSFDAQAAYRYQPDAKNSLYGRITHFHNITSSLYSGDYDSWQHLWKGETLLQLDYTRAFNDRIIMMLSPGASWLNYKLHGNDLQSYWNFRLNAWVRYLFHSKHWVGLGVSVGNNQPDISYLNTASQTIDFYQIKRGNLYLDNTKIYTAFVMYEGSFHRLLNVQGRVWFEKDANNIYTHYYVEKDKLISSYASDDAYRSTSAELALSSRFSDNLRTNIRFKYAYMDVLGRAGFHQSNYSATLDVNYFIRSFAFNAYVKTSEKTLDQTTLAFLKVPATYGFSIRYSGKKWMAEAGTENPFTKHLHYREEADYGAYRYHQVRTSRIYQQTGYIKLAYTFDFGKKTSREANDVDRNINSAILKAE